VNNRVLAFEGIHNFRDYGGYAARGGARMTSGLLYRSSQHKDATLDDLEKLDALGLTTIIDLRGDNERKRHPCPRPAGFDAKILIASGKTTGVAPHVEAARDMTSAEDVRSSMARHYRDMPFRPQLGSIFSQYFEALAERDGPSLIHCLAGKDRTGISVAVLHHLLGVHPDDIMADYLLTNSAGNVEGRIAAGIASIQANNVAGMSEDGMRMLMSVQPEWLSNAMDEMVERHGSVEAYARDLLGVTQDRLAKIEGKLLD
jgi:protein-tyrosine phosphatase